MSYTIRKDENYKEVLQRNGVDCVCPFQSPLATPVQTALGQMGVQLLRMPCSIVCPFAEIISDWDEQAIKFGITYCTQCTGRNVDFDIESTEPQSKLII